MIRIIVNYSMKKITILFLLSITLSFGNSLGLSKMDIVILKKIKSLTDDNYMKYTLMAIAIKESSVGKNLVNPISNDYGLFQANIKSVIKRQKVKDTIDNRRYFAQKLVYDVGFSTANAIVEIDYWKKVHQDNWIKIWASYNTGWSYSSNTGISYATSVFDIIKKLKYEYNL
ncbi:MAG: transglycosylase SLT domain-containing protein [Aliarcobacter sp.]|nr:transglycosylase SLT domain-containing protein [Aliarcobacter sp.]